MSQLYKASSRDYKVIKFYDFYIAMPAHSRYTDAEQNTQRVILKFTRPDLLYRGTITAPDSIDHALPTQDGSKLAGPTILDMIKLVPSTRPVLLPAPGKARPARQVASQPAAALPKANPAGMTWRIRPDRDFFTFDAEALPGQQYTLRPSLLSGGEPVTWKMHPDFVRVDKLTTLSMSAVAMRLAIGMMGSIEAAHGWVTGLARDAWAADLSRSLALWDRINEAGGSIAESPDLRALRPVGSVSGDIEHTILRQSCVWLGVDPDLDCSRPPGRPRTAKDDGSTDQGKIIAVTVSRAGVVTGKVIKDYRGIPAGVELVAVPVLMLVEMLGALRGDTGAERDADLLEAYLDVTAPDWRSTAGASTQDDPGFTATAQADAYDILGVTPATPFDEVTRAYRSTMQRIHPDTSHLPR